MDHYRRRFPEDDVQYFDEINFVNIHRDGNTVVPIHLGLGCQLFVRMKDGELSALFTHCDSWGTVWTITRPGCLQGVYS